MQGFDFSWNLHLERERIDFSCGSFFFRGCFSSICETSEFWTNFLIDFCSFNENPKPCTVRCVRISTHRSGAWTWNSSFGDIQVEVSLFSYENLQWIGPQMSGILDFRHFSLRLFYDRPNYFFLAGCAEPRCDDLKEGNWKFQGNTSFSVSRAPPGPQISESGEHVCFSGNRVSFSGFSGNRVSLSGAPGAPGGRGLTRTRNQKFV